MRPQQANLFAIKGPKRKKVKEAPAPLPWACAIIAVDTAANSGWAITYRGEYDHSGEVDTTDECQLLELVKYAARQDTPVVLVLEAPYGGHKHPGEVATLVALGMARERWERAWKANGQAASRIVRVQPSTWRAAVLGRITRMKTPELRKVEARVAKEWTGLDCGQDEAAAVCIAIWATKAAEVGHVIGERARAASELAWGTR